MSSETIVMAASSYNSLPTPTFISSSAARSGGATVTVTAPTGIQNGDLLVAVMMIDETGTTSTPATVPAGFSLSSIQSNRFRLATKVASSESGNYTFGIGTSSRFTTSILVYRNATNVNTVGAIAVAATATAITPTKRGTLVGVFSSSNATTVSAEPSGMTSRSTVSSVAPSTYVYDFTVQGASSTGTKAVTWVNPGTTWSILLQVTNESQVAPVFVATASAQAAVTGTTVTINKPTGTADGDLMIAAVFMPGPSSGTWTFPAGWTEIADQNSRPNLAIGYKIAASEGSNYSFVCSTSGGRPVGSMMTYRYASYDTISNFATGSPVVTPSTSPTESQSLLVAVIGRDTSNLTVPTPVSMNVRVTDNDSISPSYGIFDQVVAKGPAGGRISDTGGANSVGISLSIKPTRT